MFHFKKIFDINYLDNKVVKQKVYIIKACYKQYVTKF